MFSRTVLPALLALAAATIAHAGGSGIVNGRIVDSGSGFPLPGAHVMLDGKEPGAVSDRDGRFKFTGAAVGDHEITVTYIGYTPAAVPVTVSGTKVAALEIELTPGVLVADEVVVVSERLQGQARALNQQKQSPNITNVVAADQVGRFPDANIGDAIKRIPGIVVANDQGEARFGLIRGTEARLNSITLNGERVPSAEGEVRAVQLDLVPADMIQTIEVNKALTPDMDADAIGGAVNLVTRAAPGSRRLSGTLGSGYNFLSGQPTGLSSVVAGDRFLDGRLGAIVSASYHNHRLGSDNIEAEWDEEDGAVYMSEFQIRKYDVDRIRSSLSGALDYRLDDRNELYLSAMFNQRDDYENRYRLTVQDLELPEGGVTPEGQIRRQTKGGSSDIGDARLEDQATASMTVGGKHLLGTAFEVDWSATYARASEERPDERYIQYRVRDIGVRPDIGDPERPDWSAADEAAIALSEFELHEITEENQFTEEEDLNARVDFSFPWLQGESGNRVQFGFRYRGKEKLRDNDFFEYEPLDDDGFASLGTVARRDYSDSGFLAGDYLAGEFVTEEFLGGLALDDPEQFERSDLPEEYVPGNYEARETVTGGYLMVEQALGPRLDLLLGLRVEDTRIEYTGNELFIDPDADEEVTTRPVTGDDGYLHLLPGLHARYRLDDATALRFAWTNTLARPNYYDLVPYREVLIEDEELFEGNPALDPTTSMNFDLMAERYFSTVGPGLGGAVLQGHQRLHLQVRREGLRRPGQRPPVRRLRAPPQRQQRHGLRLRVRLPAAARLPAVGVAGYRPLHQLHLDPLQRGGASRGGPRRGGSSPSRIGPPLLQRLPFVRHVRPLAAALRQLRRVPPRRRRGGDRRVGFLRPLLRHRHPPRLQRLLQDRPAAARLLRGEQPDRPAAALLPGCEGAHHASGVLRPPLLRGPQV